MGWGGVGWGGVGWGGVGWGGVGWGGVGWGGGGREQACVGVSAKCLVSMFFLARALQAMPLSLQGPWRTIASEAWEALLSLAILLHIHCRLLSWDPTCPPHPAHPHVVSAGGLAAPRRRRIPRDDSLEASRVVRGVLHARRTKPHRRTSAARNQRRAGQAQRCDMAIFSASMPR